MTRIRFVDLPNFKSASAIEQRFTATLKRIRARKAKVANPDEPWTLDDDDSDLSYADNGKIRRRAELLSKRQAIRAGIVHLKKEELVRIEAVVPDVALVMAGDEDWADAAAASLHAEMPWMARATEHLWHALRRAARRGGPVAMRPIILNGPPGIGKSVWARKLGQTIGLPTVDIDASKGSAGFAVAGLERGWASALPGRPLDLVLSTRVSNPLIIIDEVCKAKQGRSEKGNSFSFADALLSLIEPATAANWECNYFRLRFDMSHILWVMTANDVHRTPEPVRSRCQVIELPDISPAQLADFALGQGRRMGLSEDGIAAIVEVLDRAPRVLGRRLSLRDVIRMLERGEMLEERPKVQ